MTILDQLRARQNAHKGTLARNVAVVRKDMAVYADASAVGMPQVDEAQMLSWWTISSTAQDREGDILDPQGCLPTIKNYARNPVVSFDHFAHDPLPVGTSMGDGMLPVIVTDSGIRACCKHHCLTPLAADVWALTRAKVLRACSIGFLPLEVEQLGNPAKGSLANPRYLFKAFDITEWAICSVGVNPEALRMEMSAGRVKDERLRKSLADLAQKPLIYEHGWNPTEDGVMSVNFRQIQTVRLAKAQYPNRDAASKWLKSMGLSDIVLVERPKSWEFIQKIAEPVEASVKLDKGIEAWLSKALPDDEEEKKKKAEDDDKPEEKDEVADDEKSDDKPDEEDKPGEESDKSEEKPGEEKPDEESKADDAENADSRDPEKEEQTDLQKEATGDESRTTLGAMTLADVMNHYRGAIEYLDGATGLNDHPAVIALLGELASNCQEAMAKVESAFKTEFPALNLDQLISEQAGDKGESMNEATGSDGGYLLEEDDDKKNAIKSLEEIRNALAAREKSLAKTASWQDKVCERFKLVV